MRKYITIALFLLCAHLAKAQIANDSLKIESDSLLFKTLESNIQDSYKLNLQPIIPSSPQSQIYEKYLNHEIAEYNGLPQIEIPLYEIKIKGLTIPITLSYHAGGIKYRQFDGEVGAGWSINTGGYRVARTVKGKTDENTEFYSDSEYEKVVQNARVGDFKDNLAKDRYLARINGHSYNTENFLHEGKNFIDSEYDDFSYMIPSSNGHFTITERDAETNIIRHEILQGSRDQIFLDIENNDAPMNRFFLNKLNGFEIKDENGFIYNLGGKLPDDSYLIEKSNPLEHVVYSTAWPLQKIISPFNEEVQFSYKKIQTGSEDYNNNPILNIVQPECADYIGTTSYEPMRFSNTFPRDISLGATYNTMFFVDIIKTENVIIVFERDREVSSLLKRILIQNYQGETIKQISFNYERKLFHTLLSSIKIGDTVESEKEYNFNYYDAPNVAEKNIYPDQWGYYSGESASNIMHHDILNRDAFYHSELGKLNVMTYGINFSRHLLTSADLRPVEDVLQESYARFQDRGSAKVVPDFFSLKTISFPTGGYTEYQYESHEYRSEELKKNVKGGGLRIKTIISRPDLESPEITTRYKYGKNENGLGIPNVDLTWRDFVDHSLALNGVQELVGFDGYNATIRASGILLCSTSPLLAEGSNFKIQYDEVHKYQYPSEKTEYKEKTISRYKIENQYVFWHHPENDYQGPHIMNYGSLLNSAITQWRKQVKEYNPVNQPKLSLREIYDREGKMIQKEEYQFLKKDIKDYKGVKTIKMASGHIEPLDPMMTELYGSTLHSYFAHFPYYLKDYTEVLDEKITTSYTHSGTGVIPTTVKEKYSYNTKNQLNKKSVSDSNNSKVTTEYKYPQDFTGEGDIYKKMLDNNMVSPIIEQITKHGNSLVGKIKTEYTDNSSVTTGLILPSVIKTATTDNNYRIEYSYDKYDIKGNPLQITDINNTTSYLWSYNYQYPIAELVGCKYSEIGIDGSLIAKSRNPDMTIINNLRNKVSLAGSLINTYEYEELKGMTKHTDPRGVNTHYGYDEFGRLVSVKDHNMLLMEEYKYNYHPNPMMMLTMTMDEEYIVGTTARISVQVANGSGNYAYSWTLADTDGNVILNTQNGTNIITTPLLSKIGIIVVTCHVYDKTRKQQTSIKRTFKVTHLPVKIEVHDTATGKFPEKYHLLSGNNDENTKTFKIIPKDGSGNYSYEWFLAFSDTGTKLEYGSNDTFQVTFDQKKSYELFCKVTDIETKRTAKYTTNIVVGTQIIGFVEPENISGVGKIILQEPALIRFQLLVKPWFAPNRELTDEELLDQAKLMNSVGKAQFIINGITYKVDQYGQSIYKDIRLPKGVNEIMINKIEENEGAKPGDIAIVTIYQILEHGIPDPDPKKLIFQRKF